MNADEIPPPAKAQRFELPFGPGALGVRQFQHGLFPGTDRVGRSDEPRAEEKLDIVIRLMAVGGAGRREDGVGQQPASSAARETDSSGDFGAPSHPCGVEGVLKKNCHVESLARKIFQQLSKPMPPTVLAIRIVNYLTVDRPVVPIQLRHPGLDNHNDFRLRKAFAKGFERGNAHHCITHPVRGADHDFLRFSNDRSLAHEAFRATPPRMEKRASSKASSSARRMFMGQARIGSPPGSIPRRFIASFSVVNIAAAPEARAAFSKSAKSFGEYRWWSGKTRWPARWTPQP